MKITLSIFAVLSLLAPVLAQACPNFSGTFLVVTGDASAPTLKTTQASCKSVTFAYFYPNGQQIGKIYPMDNVRRQTYEDQDLKVFETSGLVGNELVNKVEDYAKADGTTITAISHFGLDSNNTLTGVDYYYDTKGNLYQSVPHVYQRQ